MSEERPGTASIRQKKALLDGVLLLDLVASFVAIAAAWFFRLLEIDMTRVAWGYFAFTGAHLMFMIITDRLPRRRLMLAATGIAQIAGIIFLGVMWHFAGGIANPIFLVALIVPLVATGAMHFRWLGLGLGILAWVIASAVALSESAELVWLVERHGLPSGVFSDAILARPDARILRGVEATPTALLTALGLFGLVALSTAPAAHLLASRVIRIHQRSAPPFHSELSAAVVEKAVITVPDPICIVYADSGQVYSASQSFLNQMILSPEQIRSRTLFELVQFDEPQSVKEAISDPRPVLVGYRVGTERRFARLSAHRFSAKGDPFVLLRFEEASELHYLTAVESALEQAKLVISQDGRVRYFNAAATDLFSGIHFGMKAESLLGEITNSGSWWNSGRAEGLIVLGGQRYVVHNVLTEAQGERLALIELRPVRKPASRENTGARSA